MTHPLTNTPTTIATGLSGPAAAPLDGVLTTLADTSPIAVTILLLARQIIPALVLVCMAHGATPAQRVTLLQTYLGTTTTTKKRPRRRRGDQTRAQSSHDAGNASLAADGD